MTDQQPPPSLAQAGPSAWLVGGGEMGDLIRGMDWSATPLGPIESWPPALRAAAGLVLNAGQPAALIWGASHAQLYNDAYRPICGARHPGALGQDFTQSWAHAWAALRAAFERALAGEAGAVEDRCVFLDRAGFVEEAFFTFSFSPIRDDAGALAGLFHTATESTAKILQGRRARVLHALAGLRARTLTESWSLAARRLGRAALDLPFVLFYQIDCDRRHAHLAASAGLGPGWAAPEVWTLAGAADASGWPLGAGAGDGRAIVVDDVDRRFPGLVCGPFPEPIRTAVVLPLRLPGHERTACLMVAGASPRLPMNDAYRGFYDLLGATLAAVAGSAIACDEERRRAEALAGLERAKAAFFSTVSHELRTPLALVLGPLEDELSAPGPVPAARRERLDMAHRNGLRLLRLVDALLDLSAIEAGRMRASYEPTDLAAFTADLAARFRPACERAGLALRVECLPLPEPVYVDRGMWEKIVLNLLANAFKYTASGTITVRLDVADGQVELCVSDTGCGIPARELARVFERFHRAKGGHRRSRDGAGIGLALVRELAALHGGSVAAQSGEDAGSTFIVTLPRGKDHLPADRVRPARPLPAGAGRGGDGVVEEASGWRPAARAGSAAVPQQASSGPRRPRILWADDDPDMRDYVGRLLAERYDVEAVADGEAALAAARERPPDLILSDAVVPRLDGRALLRELRADPHTRAIPVVLLSARVGEEARLEGREAGADDYLAKPFTAGELLARIAANLDLARVRRDAETATRREAEVVSRAAAQAVALQKSEERLRQAVRVARLGFFDHDHLSGALTFSPEFYGICDCDPDQPLSVETFLAKIHPEDRGRVMEAVSRAHDPSGDGIYKEEYRLVRPDGSVRWVGARGQTFFEGEGPGRRPARSIGAILDVTERKRAEEQLHYVTEAAQVGHWDWDVATGQFAWSERCRALFGLLDGVALTYQTFLEAVHAEDRGRVDEAVREALQGGRDYDIEYRTARDEGEVRWVHAKGRVEFGAEGRPLRMAGIVLDVTEHKAVEERLRRLSQHDILTGLPNRALLHEFAERLLARARRDNAHLAFMFVDLDRFKPINDTYGHEVGDAVLRGVAERLSACVRGEDVVGRLGGDEFLVVLAQTRSEADAAKAALHALNNLGRPYHVGDLTLQVSPSIGISLYPQDGASVDVLVKNADIAMFHAKDRGRNNFQFFRHEFNARVDEALRIESRLREGLARREFELFFQPVIDLDTGDLVAAEALIRWPAMGAEPSRFIPVAETAGFMKTLGNWVLREACRLRQEWLQRGLPDFPVAVNVSATQFRETAFVHHVAEALEQAGLPPSALRIELAESTVMKNVEEAAAVLGALHRLGVKVALDDFGTGCSSLSYLSHLPLDILKLDQSFICRMGEDHGIVAVVEGIIVMARSLGLEMIAKGVESEEAIAFLRRHDCHRGQGFHFSRPLPEKTFREWCRLRAA